MHYAMDSAFINHFRNLKQVFIYITNECNLSCPQCIYKPDTYFSIGDKQISYANTKKLLEDFYDIGATKLTLLGGEPTLYKDGTYGISDVIFLAKQIGYKYVRMDTNGIFPTQLLSEKGFKEIDEISFSIDGYDENTNDRIRGNGSFEKAINNIKAAVKSGYTVDITCCLYEELLEKTSQGDYRFEQLIFLSEKLGVKRLNFHPLIKDGSPIDTWSDDLFVSPHHWIEVYKKMCVNIDDGKYCISVRIPQSFVEKKEFESNPQYYGFCPAKLGERVLIHPNGVIRICSALLCSAYGIADYTDDKIIWNGRKTNELSDHLLTEFTPCTNRSKKDFDGLLPLCFSFKPRQKEYVYEHLLNWEGKRDLL